MIQLERAVIDKSCGTPVVTATVGGVVELRCLSLGDDDYDRTWKNGSAIINGSDARVTLPTRINRILTVRDVTVSDAGLYTCILTPVQTQGMPVGLADLINDTYEIELVVTGETCIHTHIHT